MKKIFYFAIVASLFTACSEDNNGPELPPPPIDNSTTVTFDNAELSADGYLWGKPLAKDDHDGSMVFDGAIYSEDMAFIISYFTDFYGMSDAWCRFTVSGNHDKTTVGLDNQFSVYTTKDDGNNKFAAAYEMQGMGPGTIFNPKIMFKEEVSIKSIDIANATWTYLYLQDKYTDYAVRIDGYNLSKKTGSITFALASNNTIVDNWSGVDLSSLGVVTELVFTAICTNTQVPTYFCVDNIKYVKQASSPYNVISFELTEELLDVAGDKVALGNLEIEGGWAASTQKNVFSAKYYMEKEDFNGTYFDDLLFSTADGAVKFGSYFTDNKYSQYGASDVWGGIVLSQNYDKTPETSPDYTKQFSAWTTTAANDSRTFAICYDNGYGVYNYHTPKIGFASATAVEWVYLANATVTAQYKSSKSDFSYAVKITGFANGVEGKSIEQVLITATSVSDWVKVDLTSLGKVDELRFKVVTNDTMAPSYFCMDDITTIK